MSKVKAHLPIFYRKDVGHFVIRGVTWSDDRPHEEERVEQLAAALCRLFTFTHTNEWLHLGTADGKINNFDAKHYEVHSSLPFQMEIAVIKGPMYDRHEITAIDFEGRETQQRLH